MTHATEIADARAAAHLAHPGVLPDPTVTTGRPYWGWSGRWECYCYQSIEDALLSLDLDAYRDIYIAQYEADLVAELGAEEA